MPIINHLWIPAFIAFLALRAIPDALAQKVSVTSEAREIDGARRQGMGTLVEYDRKTVEKSWRGFLKKIGKTDSWKSGALVVLTANVENTDLAGYDHITLLSATSEGTKIFWSLTQKGDFADPASPTYQRAKAMLQDFGRQLIREDVGQQIDAAEKVVDVATRTHDKTVQMGEHLRRNLERNQQDQVSLQKQIEEKRAEAERLRGELSQNKTDQEAALEEIRKVRKIAEERRAKLAAMAANP